MGKTRLMAGVWLALAAAAVLAETAAGGRLLSAVDPEGLASYLQEIGYRTQLATDLTGDPWIRLGLAGMEGSVWFNDCDDSGHNCESIRLQVGLLTDRKLTLLQVNEFNTRWRYATLSLDEDGDPLLDHDLRLASPGLPAATVGWTVRQFEEVAAELRRLVNEGDEAPAAQD